MTDNLVDIFMLFGERDESHPVATWRTKRWIYLIHLASHLGPPFGRHIDGPLFGDRWVQRITACLTHLPSIGLGVEAVVANYDLTLVKIIRGD